MGANILRLRPCRRPPLSRQLAELNGCLLKWLTFYSQNCYLETLRLHFGSLSDFLVIQGSTGTPNRHLEVQLSIFSDFWMHFGSLLGPTVGTFCDLSMILGAKVGDSFQVHVFGDPGMEMMPECSGCMCLNRNKNCVFLAVSPFSTDSLIWCPEEGFWVSF